METSQNNPDQKFDKYPILEEKLGRRLSTKEVATYLGLDEDTVRKYYTEIGGIRPTGPKGRILFFENNMVSALSRSNANALKDNKERTNAVEGESAEEQGDQNQAVSQQEAGADEAETKNKQPANVIALKDHLEKRSQAV